jgi:exodeoxyribonuclease V alpha subunit
VNSRLKPQPEPSTQEVLAGLVERVTYHNAENGFCVIRIKARGHRELVTAVGHAATISAGEWVTASGEWINDPHPWPAVQVALYAHLGTDHH